MFVFQHTQSERESQCLTFLVIDGVGAEGPESVRVETGENPGLGRPALAYSLETGMVRWRDPSTGEYRPPIALRSNSRLAQWEPMTADKFELMAVELGVLGGSDDLSLKSGMDIGGFVVSPDGYVIAWDDPTEPRCSDVVRLNESGGRRLADFSSPENVWLDGPERALVGNGALLSNYIDSAKKVHTLDDCQNMAAGTIEISINRLTGEYTPAAAQFVADQFGVDTASVDWKSAIKARLINSRYADTAPFDPVAATQALRLAAGNSARPQPLPATAPRSAMSHTDTAPQTRPGTTPNL